MVVFVYLFGGPIVTGDKHYITYVVPGGLLLHTPVGSSPWHAVAWCGGILTVSVAGCGALFRHRTG